MQRSPRRSPNRLGVIFLVVFLGLLGVAGVAAFKTLTFVSSVSTANLGDNIRSIITTSSAAPSAPPGRAPDPSGRINVLLLGYGGVGHDGALLTDSVMVLSLDQHTKKAAMISVPRDLWVKVPYLGEQGGFYKLNAAYAIGADDDTFPNKASDYRGSAGGGNLASTVVSALLGLKIDYWVAVDFYAFRGVVDALGGVDVDVEKAFIDYYYPRNDDPLVDSRWMTVRFNAGTQHMSGERALQYARSRHSLDDGTDFGRSRRQQRLLLAIKDKALSPEGAARLFGLTDSLSKDFKTNMNVGQIRALADLAKGIDPANIERVSIDNTNYLNDAQSADGQDVLVPTGKTWTPLRNYIASLLLDPAIKSENATVQLFNGGGLTSLAMTVTSMLHDIGLQTLPPQNLDSSFSQETVIHDFTHGRDISTVNYLANLFNAKIVIDTPTPSDQADIKIVLGRGYQEPNSFMDSFDPGIRTARSAPPLIDTSQTQVKPSITPSTSAIPAASSAASVAASARPSTAASAAPSAVVRASAAPVQPTPTPTRR